MDPASSSAVLNADMFPFPGTWGLEWLGLVAGRDFLRLFLLFWWCWFLDWGSEEARERFSGRKLDFMATLVSFAVLVGGFFLALFAWFGLVAKSEWADVQYLCQTTANLSATECGVLAALSLAAAWVLSRACRRSGLDSSRFSLRLFLPLLPPLLAAWFCWSHYSIRPPRVRPVALVFAEAAAVVALGGAYLAATARPVWRRRVSQIRGGHWKRFVPRAFWLAFLAVFLRGVFDISGAFSLARISSGAAISDSPAPAQRPGLDSSRFSSTLSDSPSSLQRIVDSAPPGAVVDVPAGSYAPIYTRGKAITLRASDGPERTVIDASLLRSEGVTNRCATLASGRLARRHSRLFDRLQHAYQLPLSFLVPDVGGPSSMRLAAKLAPPQFPPEGGLDGTVLQGFTLRGGHADIGGGVFGGTLVDCVLEGNLAEFCGGGAFGSRLVRCTVRGNVAAWMGGGAWGGSTEDCTVAGNAAQDFGGGVWGGAHSGLSATNNLARHHPDTAAVAQ